MLKRCLNQGKRKVEAKTMKSIWHFNQFVWNVINKKLQEPDIENSTETLSE